jgi:hypothetical protein
VTEEPSIRTLKELENKIGSLSHSEAALDAIKHFSAGLRDSSERIGLFNADGALVRSPISSDETRVLGFDRPDDDFRVLQGDIVGTESAYFLGERVTNSPKYAVLSSSCDLVPNRRGYAALLRVREIRRHDPEAKAKISLLLRFKRIDSMYLPALPVDHEDVLCNVIEFDGICQIRSCDLILANRIASLSLVGWRIFASFSRAVIARATPRECQMRMAIEQDLLSFDK